MLSRGLCDSAILPRQAHERADHLDFAALRQPDGFEIVNSFGPAAQVDWIHAAAFSGSGETTLLGTYARRVVRLDREGTPITIYDVGFMPVRIIETEAFLYVMR